MSPARTRRRRAAGSAVLAVAALLSAAVDLSGCSSQPMASVRTDKNLPNGWVRYSYGALSVGAPRGWKIQSYIPLCPPVPGTTAVVEFTETTPVAASCASGPGIGGSRVIALGCLTGQALGQFAIGSSSETTFVGGHLLRRSSTQVSLKGHDWEAIFLLLPGFSPSALGQQILATVKPTGRSCR